MGEIGIPRSEFLHELRLWEIRSAVRGYYRRGRDIWSATRWQTFYTLSSQIGSDGMRKNGWNSPADLITFPWEDGKASSAPTDDEIAELREEIAAINAERTDT